MPGIATSLIDCKVTDCMLSTQAADYGGSIIHSSTTSLGQGSDGKDVYVHFKDLLPMLDPDNIEFEGERDDQWLFSVTKNIIV